jgi:ferredoxin
MKILNEICDWKKCTGCCACMNVCPVSCIEMMENDIGEIHPTIRNDQCIDCGKCIVSCPDNAQLEFKYPKKVFASWTKNKEKRLKCASGGIATLMSEHVIFSDGIVYGTAFDAYLNPHCKRANSLQTLEGFKDRSTYRVLLAKFTN